MALQKRFLDHFLKDIDNGWDKEAPVLLYLRRPFSSDFELRKESQSPLASTKWTSFATTFDALGVPVAFLSAPLEYETELTGPLLARVFISSSTTDVDLFVILQAFSPKGKEVDFQGTVDPRSKLAQGCLKSSHRKLDIAPSKPYCPFHSHDELLPVTPGEVYELHVEIWPI
ncbi:hypothetical protein BP6252_13871 [Coleophoma cylindrospora]|uniref:Xaa-Pro dipeptidyl-peptidase C-terminal domain-containing protein n=1 Tax=Coleophoma cylindrospora TaxID=1849047 RepID=A0A3D8Q5K5_9HELO|nr:hypothetical protein BP6252_13871 [Coleophoma cylindrospora]